MNSNTLEYGDVLYFDLQPHPMACTLESVVMEWKQILSELWMLSDGWLMLYKDFIKQTKKKMHITHLDLKVSEGVLGHGDGTA